MKQFVVATVVALLGLSPLASAQEATIRIATEGAYPPFNFVQSDGTLAGLDVDMANALCAEMKAKCIIVPQDWDGMIPGLMAKKFDAVIASMSITEERKKQVDFSDKYYTTPLAVVVPKDSTLKGVGVEDMKGKVVGAQAATTQAEFAARAAETEERMRLWEEEYQRRLASGYYSCRDGDGDGVCYER